MYKLITTIVQSNKVVDEYITTFGFRTLHWDANEGFFLNGKHVKIKGTNNHQDHAGVGSAMPDGLQDFRIKLLKSFGCNAYRCSHNPPTPELLDACDRLGMVVIDENRLMGTTQHHLGELKRMILRDRIIHRLLAGVLATRNGNRNSIEVQGLQLPCRHM